MLVVLERAATQIFSSEGLRWPGIWIISGHRSPAEQARVNPSIENSLHTECPALAADLRVGNLPASTTPDFWPFLGTIWKSLGGKWGGDFATPDVNHFAVITVTASPIVREAPGRTRAIAPPPIGSIRLDR